MALSILLGKGPRELVNVGRKGPKVSPENVVLIGVRDLDCEEKVLLKNSGCTVFTMRDIDELGMHRVLRQALGVIGHLPSIHLSLDMDSIDPQEAPGVGTPSPGGLTYREAQLIMETIAETGRLSSVDVMEINPILDQCNRTAQTAVSLLASLFGKRRFFDGSGQEGLVRAGEGVSAVFKIFLDKADMPAHGLSRCHGFSVPDAFEDVGMLHNDVPE